MSLLEEIKKVAAALLDLREVAERREAKELPEEWALHLDKWPLKIKKESQLSSSREFAVETKTAIKEMKGLVYGLKK